MRNHQYQASLEVRKNTASPSCIFRQSSIVLSLKDRLRPPASTYRTNTSLEHGRRHGGNTSPAFSLVVVNDYANACPPSTSAAALWPVYANEHTLRPCIPCLGDLTYVLHHTSAFRPIISSRWQELTRKSCRRSKQTVAVCIMHPLTPIALTMVCLLNATISHVAGPSSHPAVFGSSQVGVFRLYRHQHPQYSLGIN